MATYKVIQDIEAEDKLVGPLTLRQFIYAGIAAVCLYLCFLSYTKGAEFLIGFFLPIAFGAGFFAFPWKGEQPTEMWALAKLRFSIKPRVRIWDQEGAKDLVTITAPKKLKDTRPTRAALSQVEVRSRLKALADTIDSRGWATRNAAYGVHTSTWAQANVPAANTPNMAALIPDEDMFSERSPVAQNFDAMLAKSQQDQRQRVMDKMASASAPQSLLASLPNIPTPEPYSAYSVAPAPAPTPIAGAALKYQPPQAQQLQQAAPAPAGQWFANGPAYPAQTPANPLMQQPVQTPAIPLPPQAPPVAMNDVLPPQPGSPSLPAPAVAMPAAAAPYQAPPMPTYQPPSSVQNDAVPFPSADPRIESDMPLAIPATPTEAEMAAGQQIKQQNDDAVAISYAHMRVLQPAGQAIDPTNPSVDTYQPVPGTNGVAAGDQYVDGGVPQAPQPPMTPPPNPAILELANNDDLDIATLARQANREMNKAPDEVEIRLH